ncbi:WD-repeat region-domain-containing protein [Neocallimastix sp. 'constans']
MLNNSSDLNTFLIDLKDLLEKKGIFLSSKKYPLKFMYKLINEFDEIGWDKISNLKSDLHSLTININDSYNRKHKLNLIFPYNYNTEAIEVKADIPEQINNKYYIDELSNIIEFYKNIFDKYNDFWCQLEEIDKKTWVIEPINPPRSSTYRRIIIERKCSINIQINPSNPRSIPIYQLMGSDELVQKWTKILINRQYLWNLNNTIYENLKKILDIDFPQKEKMTLSDISEECGICYSHYLTVNNGDKEEMLLPDKQCKNSKCSRSFHYKCLFEWLRSLTTTKTSFNYLYGKCPYCEEMITLPIN